MLAQLLSRADRNEEAEEVLEEAAHGAAAERRALPGAWPYCGRRCAQRRRRAAYRKAVEIEDTVETELQLARFLERSARLEEARKILAAVDISRPESPPVLGDFELLAGEPVLAGRNYAGHLEGERGAGETTGAEKALSHAA